MSIVMQTLQSSVQIMRIPAVGLARAYGLEEGVGSVVPPCERDALHHAWNSNLSVHAIPWGRRGYTSRTRVDVRERRTCCIEGGDE